MLVCVCVGFVMCVFCNVWMGVCMCGFCNVLVCVGGGFVMCVCFVMCGWESLCVGVVM